jgi:hypothetical protein
VVAARGGGSGNQVSFTIDAQSATACSIAGATVIFSQPGICVIDANQAGNDRYLPAPQAQQKITVTGNTKTTQSILFISKPSSIAVGTTYVVAARGGGSGNPVTFTIDSPSASVCSVSGATVTFNQPGTCVIDANQAGNDQYLLAAQAQQKITVKLSQTISFSSKPSTQNIQGDTYDVTATATSHLPVTLSTDSSGVCSIVGTTVTFNQSGTCVIDANQAGNDQYLPAPQAQQQATVVFQVP